MRRVEAFTGNFTRTSHLQEVTKGCGMLERGQIVLTQPAHMGGLEEGLKGRLGLQ